MEGKGVFWHSNVVSHLSLPLLNSRSENEMKSNRLKLLGIRNSGLKMYQCDIPHGFSIFFLPSPNRFSICLPVSNIFCEGGELKYICVNSTK